MNLKDNRTTDQSFAIVYEMLLRTTKNINVIMTNNESKIYVCEWDKQPDTEEYNLKVTEHQSAETALQQAQSSNSDSSCISTVNPVGEDKK